ncbi:MAG: 23S rRNA (uracil(1939)-C(5))-methyltransferase RlmD [Treponema sp.]|nr:23S rRNA (uracil(1939)-C(5))-methyltransferase RlmD [Treponema sp.]
MALTVTTEKMVTNGDCIAKVDGKIVFVPYALPDETLEIEITSSNRDYDTAKIVNIVKESEHRVTPPCKYYGMCGGCNMMHIAPSFQREMKKNILATCLLREGIPAPEIAVLYGSNEQYRARILLGNGGFSCKRSNSVVPIEQCFVATNEINEWLLHTPYAARPQGKLRLFGDKRVVPEKTREFAHVVAACDNACKQQHRDKNSRNTQLARSSKKSLAKQYVRSMVYRKDIKQVPRHFSGTVASPEKIVKVALLGKEIAFDVRGFFQSNMDVLEKSLDVICGNLSGTNALDMYAGCGTFSRFLAERFEHVTLVEHNRDALAFAEQNMAGFSHASFGVSGENWVRNFSFNNAFDAVIIDPPRSGIEKSVCDFLCAGNTPYIRSVSCNCATHARDIAKLVHAGYKLVSLSLLDFFPNTSHIESVAVLEKTTALQGTPNRSRNVLRNSAI